MPELLCSTALTTPADHCVRCCAVPNVQLFGLRTISTSFASAIRYQVETDGFVLPAGLGSRVVNESSENRAPSVGSLAWVRHGSSYLMHIGSELVRAGT